MSVIGFTCGSWDLLHAGHISFLRYCAERVNHLLVGLQVDPSLDRPEKNKPVQTMYERYNQLAACKWVSEVVPYEDEADLLNLIACEQFQVRFMGDEYVATEYTGKDLCEQLGMAVVFVPRLHTFSSSGLRNRVVACPRSAGSLVTGKAVLRSVTGVEESTVPPSKSNPPLESA